MSLLLFLRSIARIILLEKFTYLSNIYLSQQENSVKRHMIQLDVV
jgi:hypothetical protein